MDKIIEKWDEILNTVKQEYEISDVSFDTWIRPLEVFAIEGILSISWFLPNRWL